MNLAIKNAKIYGDFYSPEKVLSYNRPWIFSVGSRSIGKSTGWALRLLDEYIKKGSKFIYVRRTEEELLSTCKNFFDNAIIILKDNGYKINGFKYEARNYYIKLNGSESWTQCGTIIPLSQEQKYKSSNFQDYKNILYDEFISRDPSKYLGNKSNPAYEFDCCISLFQTVDRGIGVSYQNETKFIFCANNSSYFNPIFIALGITDYIRTDTKILAPKGKLWIVEQTRSVKGTERIKESYGYLLSDARNQKYAYDNIGFDHETNFVEKINEPMRGIINVQYRDKIYGIYLVPKLGKIYVSTKASDILTIALTCGDQSKINYLLAERYNQHPAMISLRNAYFRGDVVFENARCKYDITNYFMLTT